MSNSVLEQLQHHVSQGQLRQALEELNLLAGCRFTAFFQFSEEGLRNLVLVDQQDRAARLMDTVPVEQSYCAFVQASKDAFVVSDSLTDARLGDHVKRPIVKSYFGFPVKVDGRDVFGTVCHFDFDVVDVRSEVLALTRSFAEGFDSRRAMEDLRAGLERRLDSLSRMSDTILESAATQAEVAEAFSTYLAPLLAEAERVLSPSVLAAYLVDARALEMRFTARAESLP